MRFTRNYFYDISTESDNTIPK